MGAWLEQTCYLWIARRASSVRMLLVLLLPLVAIGLFLFAILLTFLFGPIDRFVFGADGGGNLEGFWITLILPGALWLLGASLGSISITFIDVVVSALVKGFRARITLAIGMLIASLSTVVGLLVWGAESMRRNVEAGRPPTKDWKVTAQDDSSRQTIDAAGDWFIAHPWGITAAALGLAFIIGMPSVISACTKLADAVLLRILPLMKAFDAVAEGDREVRVEEAGSAELIELARHFNRMLDHVRSGERMERAFGLYVGDKLLDRIKGAHGDGLIEASTKDATVWFADIRGFTTMSEQLSPEAVVSVLNRYFDRVLAVIDDHDGFLDKFIGDAVVVVFNGPVDQPDHALRAVQCAAAVLRTIAQMNAEDAFPEIGALHVGAGVNSGAMVCGNIGSSKKVEYTVIGDAVNLASRVEGMTKLYGAPLLITGETYDRFGDHHELECRRVDRVAAKGKAEAVDLYEVLDGQEEEQRVLRLKNRDVYAEAFRKYIDGDFENAASGFAVILDENDADTAARLLQQRCLMMQSAETDLPWDGVFRMQTK